MVTSPPRTSREVRLVAVPQGLPTPADFALGDASLPPLRQGQVLVRNRQFVVFPGLRTLIGGGARSTPLPGLEPGDALFGPAVGEVVAVPPGSGLGPGDLVTHLLGWREYAVVPEAQCTAVDPALPDPVAHLSPGSAAYGALTRVAPVREGDVVLVTGAAGGVGSAAGRIARLLGAARVIGTTRSPDKAVRLTAESGYDAALTAGADFAGRLAAAAPDGIDVVLDLVGGAQLSAAVDAARPGARIALVGSLSGQLAAGGRGERAPVEIDAYRLVLLGASVRGYLGSDHPGVEEEWRERFGHWLRSGEIGFPLTRIAGIERAPQALWELIEGRHFGTVVVELARDGGEG
ncbi:MDR family NADP-dependent oxidoreductase [Streptomyces camelliae]|uniref:NADP-dependent oxidoreductase n=1 Tax=Streptomyces camelliae TaxID=3004093 RepID=A0ABY7PFB2_9ACTN|nr:NADP-dependent oxidoreductase [Streptomyces sp. HUAS 2-6]WBO68267.1 NADP-dependent oxidoreductase [Streptomyces sp. HUAS 2-6]